MQLIDYKDKKILCPNTNMFIANKEKTICEPYICLEYFDSIDNYIEVSREEAIKINKSLKMRTNVLPENIFKEALVINQNK